MRPPIRIGIGWQVATLAALLCFWLALSALLVVGRGDPETFLSTTFTRSSQADAFEHLNGPLAVFWVAHSSLFLVAFAAVRLRRLEVLAVLLVGPMIAPTIGLLGQSWADPNWFVVVAVCTIGWLVSTVVAVVFWSLRPGVDTAKARDAGGPRRGQAEPGAAPSAAGMQDRPDS